MTRTNLAAAKNGRTAAHAFAVIATALLLAFSLFGLTACGGGEEESAEELTAEQQEANAQFAEQLVGTWRLTHINEGGNAYTVDEYCTEKGYPRAQLDLSITLNQDGTMSMGLGDGEASSGTYSADAETMTATLVTGGNSVVYQVDGTSMSYTDQGMESVFTKELN